LFIQSDGPTTYYNLQQFEWVLKINKATNKNKPNGLNWALS